MRDIVPSDHIVKFTALDNHFDKILLRYAVMPSYILVKIKNKTKTSLNEEDVYIFENISEAIEFFENKGY